MCHKIIPIFVSYMNIYMKRLVLCIVAVLISVIATARERKQTEVVWSDVDGVSVPIPPMEHPRLFVRSVDIPALKAKMEHPEGKKILKKLRKASVPKSLSMIRSAAGSWQSFCRAPRSSGRTSPPERIWKMPVLKIAMPSFP
jgi:hypothetical protein